MPRGESADVPHVGILLIAVLAGMAWYAGLLAPLIGAPVFALLAGFAIRNTLGVPAFAKPAAEFTLRRLLRVAIVLFGATLSFSQVLSIGAGSFAVIAVTIALGLGLVYAFGRWLGAPAGLVGLIGVGTAICGATAILTIGPIMRSREDEIAFAVTTIFLFNMLAVLVYPALGHLLAMPDAVYGVWVGAAVHDTSSVLAASLAFSEPAGRVATVVKLLRTLALVPLALAFGLAHSLTRPAGAVAAGAGEGGRINLARIFPWFVLWFAVAALLNTAGLISADAGRVASLVGKFLVVMVMAGVGLSADVRRMIQIGPQPLVIGLAASVMIAVVSLSLIRLLVQ